MNIVKELTTNKYLEICLGSCDWPHNIFSFDCSLTKETDHAGFMFCIQLLKFKFEFNITDNRHWNYDEDKWYNFGEKEPDDDDFIIPEPIPAPKELKDNVRKSLEKTAVRVKDKWLEELLKDAPTVYQYKCSKVSKHRGDWSHEIDEDFGGKKKYCCKAKLILREDLK